MSPQKAPKVGVSNRPGPARPGRVKASRPCIQLTLGLAETLHRFRSHAKIESEPKRATRVASSRASFNSIPSGRFLVQPSTIVPRVERGVHYEHDNEHADLVLTVGSTLHCGRFEVLYELGSGGFGQVVLCRDRQTPAGELRAIKILKSGADYDAWGNAELQNLELINSLRGDDRSQFLVQYYESFREYHHTCIVFEHLKMNLYEVIAGRDHKGLPFNRIREVSRQLLTGLACLANNGVIHADVKPENLMLSETASADWVVKLIDFGTTCRTSDQMFTYIQSRYYRSPEVIVGARYDCGIDAWAAGATIAEMFLGIPLLPGTCEYEQLRLIEQRFGMSLPHRLLEGGSKTEEFYVRDAGGAYRLKRPEQYYSELGRPLEEQPRCYRYDEYRQIMCHRPFTVEDIQSAFVALRSGLTRHSTNTTLASSASALAFHEATVCRMSQEVQADNRAPNPKEIVHFVEAERQQLTDLVQKLMDVDPLSRLTVAEALKHPFIFQQE